MMARKRSRALASSRAEPCKRLDKAEQRGERRAQFVAGIGDEVGAHFLDPAQRREIVKGDQHEIGPRRIRLALDRHHDGLEPAIDRHALGIDDALHFVFRRGAADRFDQFGHPQRERDRLALPQRRRQRAGALIERQHAAVAIECHDRIGQAGDDGAQKTVAAFGHGDRLGQAILVFGGADREHDGAGDDGETAERIGDGQRAGERQGGEHGSRRHDHHAPAAPAPRGKQCSIFNQAHKALGSP